MNTLRTRTRWLDDPKHIKLLWRGFIVVLAFSVFAEFLFQLHPAFRIDGWFGFNAAYGFIACTLMIVVAKVLGFLIKRPDTFYKEDDVDD